MKKPKVIEITLSVRVPADMTAARAKHEVSQAWYGEIYALMQPKAGDTMGLEREVSLFPKWGKARVVPKA